MEKAYAALGRAVFAAQLFETALIPIFEFFKMQTEPGYIAKTGGYVSAGAFKIPIKNIVKYLSEKGSIASDLEARLAKYVDARHLLVHRWVQQHGWPDDNDAQGFAPIVELASYVECEAKELTRQFAGYMVKYADPNWAAGHDAEYKERMRELFQRAHIDG
jgi:hypothetical protein